MSGAPSPEDPEDLGTCYNKNAKMLYRYALFLTRNERILAEDLVEETFVVAAEKWETLSCWTDDSRRRWLRAVLTKLQIDHFRRNEMQQRRQWQINEKYRFISADTHNEAVNSMALEKCWAVIEHLSPRQHLIAIMRWREGMKVSEIAAELRIKNSTVYAHIDKIREQIRAQIGPYHPFVGDDAEGDMR